MILKKLIINNYCGIFGSKELDIEPDLTILTGANDTGKSNILELIKIICTDQAISESQVNYDYIHLPDSPPWNEGNKVNCLATFQFTDISAGWGQATLPHDEVSYEFYLSRGKDHYVATHALRDGKTNKVGQSYVPNRFPHIIKLSQIENLNSIIVSSHLNDIEKKFLENAFGGRPVETLLNLNSRQSQRNTVRRASKKLNESIHSHFPFMNETQLVLDLLEIDDEQFSLSINIQDNDNSDTPLTNRGSGVRKILTLLTQLLAINSQDKHIIILIDEPENSLHADAQHALRKFLENLSSQETIQVIYATHSPSMINAFKADKVRLLKREQINNVATTTIVNRPMRHNFQLVRTSLGLTPHDSLLYAPITILVEGMTETVCLPLILEELHKANKKEFDNVQELLSLTHFLNAEGGNFNSYYRLVQSQSCFPLVFIDGDNHGWLRDFQKNNSESIIIQLQKGQEFEDLIEKEIYFQALAKQSGKSFTFQEFEDWSNNDFLPPDYSHRAFTKKIDFWLNYQYPDIDYHKVHYKPQVMKNAILLALEQDMNKINISPVIRLIQEMENIANKL